MAFYDVVKSLCDKKGISIRKLEREIGASNGSISHSKNGVKPNAERIQQIAEYFQVPIDYLLTGVMPEPEDGYYRNDQTKEIAQFLFDNPEYGVLFDAAKDVRPEDIQLVIRMIKGVNSTNDNSYTGC
jgi:transcriptional regulator with XRE-family HTH domain